MTRPGAEGIVLLPLSGDQRGAYGCIVTFSDGSSRWFPGRDGLRDATVYCDRHEPPLKIRTISTPETIYRDLQGSRAKQDSRHNGAVVFPEQKMIGYLRRADLLEVDRALARPQGEA